MCRLQVCAGCLDGANEPAIDDGTDAALVSSGGDLSCRDSLPAILGHPTPSSIQGLRSIIDRACVKHVAGGSEADASASDCQSKYTIERGNSKCLHGFEGLV